MRAIVIVLRTSLLWAIAWGFSGAAITFAAMTASSAGHFGRGLAAETIGAISFGIGFLAGLIFASLARTPLNRRARFGLGSVIGAIIVLVLFLLFAVINMGPGVSFTHSLIHSLVPFVLIAPLAAGLGGLLGVWGIGLGTHAKDRQTRNEI